jgi:hypothetical protein
VLAETHRKAADELARPMIGKLRQIRSVLNPDKLVHVPALGES